MRATRFASRRFDAFCCFLSYVLVISLCAPLPPHRALAATPDAEKKASSTAHSRAIKQNSQRRAGELIIRFREGISEQDKDAHVSIRGMRRKKTLRGQSRIEKLELQPGQEPEAVAAELRALPAVVLVEPNFLISRDEIIPNDPRFSEQWALKNNGQSGGLVNSDISVTAAWETTTGDGATVIAVVDSGIDFAHPDLRNNQWTNAKERENGRDEDRDGFTDDLYGWDWIANDNSIHDEQGHGTSIAGIIAAQGNNRRGIAGVMWQASLMSLRVLDNTGTGDVADAVEAIDYAVEHGAQVINCSWGTDQESAALRDAIDRAGRAGVVVISSAGNSGRDVEGMPYYPASYGLPNQIAVAATDKFDTLTSWSNWGATHITIAAPGTDILTTRIGGGYTTVTGTSASTPLVTGVAGLIKTQRWWLSGAGTRAAIVNGTRRVEGLTGKVSSGGVVNASGALQALRGSNSPPGNGNGGNNGGGNGSGGNPHVRPPTPGRGSGGTGSGGGFSTTPPSVTQGIPGSLPSNLDEARRRQPTTPRAPAPIQANVLPMCDVNCGGTEPPAEGGTQDPYFATARTRPENESGQQGEDLGSQNFNWSLPILDLPGRAGLDLSLVLSYNSLVWTKQNILRNAIMFNADRGFPGPGFRLSFPVLGQQYFDYDENKYSYLLITPSGGRVDLQQTNNPNIYESIDSSYTQLVDNRSTGGSLVVRTKDGTQLTFAHSGVDGDFRCTQVKDRNGNFITITYNSLSRINTITDTLGRVVTFVYDANNYLYSITQTWSGVTHEWARFYFGDLYMQPSFASGIAVLGPRNTNIPVLTQVWLHDGSTYNFNYTPFGQVYKLRHNAQDGHLRYYTGYNLPGSEWLASSTQSDCPRYTEQREWAENWNGDSNGVPTTSEEAVTKYSVAADGSWSKMMTPDGIFYRELFATTGWQEGLTTGTEVWIGDPDDGGTKMKWTTTLWTQDDTSLTYQKNPRPYDINTYDEAGNSRHIDISYHASFGLPYEVREYSTDGSGFGGFMRRTYTDYNLSQAYIDRRVIGLVSAVYVVGENNNLVSKTSYDYDRNGEWLVDTPQTTIQHDSSYNSGFVTGRGNLAVTYRFDVNQPENWGLAIPSPQIGYDTNGSVVFTRDALNHRTNIGYTDSFSDEVNHNTFAYPTTMINADNYSTTIKYNYDHGAVIRTQDPKGAVRTITYDMVGRIDRITNQVNGAYTRWFYSPYSDVAAFTTIQSGAPEAFSVTYFDGAGRVRATGNDNPNSSGSYAGQFTLYDIMGRVAYKSNPAEMTHLWAPTGDDISGWVWTYQQYDWNGRPTLTNLPSTDGGQTSYTREVSYGGCGCAGGEVVTTRDERGRRKKMTMDVVGRLKKVEELNWNQTVYSTTNYTYNARDQITNMNHAGQVRSFEYDGHGRLWRRTTPEQGSTTYSYNIDNTVQTVVDARNATSTFTYNNRHLVTNIMYGVPDGVAPTNNVWFAYDETGNRTSMTEKNSVNQVVGSNAYHYDMMSRMDWEERTFYRNDLTTVGTYRLNYSYNVSGQLKNRIIGPSQFGSTYVDYIYDKTGRTTSVAGSGYGGVPGYINNLSYRAWGGIKQIAYSNGKTLSINYDNRLRMSRWLVTGILGWDYAYDTPLIHENTERVAFADNIYDPTLDRSYDYDHVGRMWASHTGTEARGHAGYSAWGAPDGPYAQNQINDVWGNVIWRNGWGAVNAQYSYAPQFVNNKMTVNPLNEAVVQYDAAGNLKNDGTQIYTYDAIGQQATASSTGLQQTYDGDGLRVKKIDNNGTTYYLRSSLLGKQIVAEISNAGSFQRGYIYLGGQMLALQENNQVNWVHQDPVTKSQRLTNSAGSVVSWVDLDPWGGETGRSYDSYKQPHRYTTYERDGNGGDEAMFRRYEGKWQKFAQPDPYNGSYNLTDPQSFNRYSYAENDPVNFVDPTGLMCYARFEVWNVGGRESWKFIGIWCDPDNYNPASPATSFNHGSVHAASLAQKKRINMKRIRAALVKCLKSIFGLFLADFTPSQKGKDGAAMVLNQIGIFLPITNNVNVYDSKDLNAIAQAMGYSGYNPVGVTLDGVVKVGSIPIKYSAFENYTVSDRDKRTAVDARLEGLIGGFISTQIHELGNSLSIILRGNINAFGDQNSNIDQDSGYQLELCVLKNL